ncbi:hypothetical protein VPH35_024699 [Triticum aestivum]
MAAAANWVPMGDGLRLETARAVAKAHGVPLDVVLKGCYVDAVDGPDGFPDLHGVEDHVTVTNQADGRHLIKFANYDAFEAACEAPTAPGQQEEQDDARLTVVIMPYADHDSCDKLQDLAAYPEFGYAKIDVANYDMLLWKKRDMAALNEEADKCRQLGTEMEMMVRRLLPADKWRRLGTGSGDGKIARERLLKSHLDARRYGDAHELLLLLDKGKHDAFFGVAGCYDPCRPGDNAASGDRAAAEKQATADLLERYKEELDERYGAHPLHPYPERADILKMEARNKLRRELANARREVQDIVETATREIERIADQLEAMGVEPRLLGCGI